MSASRHTPGPWRSAYPIVYAASGAELLHIGERDCATVFDGHLIAAAPELLTVAQSLVELDRLISRKDMLAGLNVILEWAQAAIAKATGGAS